MINRQAGRGEERATTASPKLLRGGGEGEGENVSPVTPVTMPPLL